MNVLLPFAKQMLQQHRGFHPFGGKTLVDGTNVTFGIDAAEDFPPGLDLMNRMTEFLQAEAKSGSIVAAGMVADAIVTPPGSMEKCDAIKVALEHRDGYAVEVFFPYSFSDDAGLLVRPAFAQRRKPEIWP